MPPTGSLPRGAYRVAPRRAIARALIHRELQLVLVTAIVVAITTIQNSSFSSMGNVSFLVADSMAVAIVAVGETLVVLTRGIDLSVAPVLGTAALAVGFLAQNHGLTPIEGLPIVLAIGALMGAGNGLMVAYAGIPPIIATLGTLAVYSGVQGIVANGQEVVTLPAAYFNLGNNDLVAGVPYVGLIGLGVTLLLALMLWRTRFGRSLYAVGNNLEAARRSGIRVRRVLMSAYSLCGALAGLGGLIFLAHVGSADSTTGTDSNIQLTAIAATLIGGSTLTGGKGGVLGSYMAAIFLSVALAALVDFQLNPIWEPAGVGVMILIAVMADPTTGRTSLRTTLAQLMQTRGIRG
jgi:ribose/xylose/arabinose/galactoside ABC-type transport system permease subunit